MIGHGRPAQMNASEALDLALRSQTDAQEFPRDSDPSDLMADETDGIGDEQLLTEPEVKVKEGQEKSCRTKRKSKSQS